MKEFIRYKIRFFCSQVIIKWYLVAVLIINTIFVVIKHMNTPNYFMGRSFNYSLIGNESNYNINPLFPISEELQMVAVLALVLFMSFLIAQLVNKENKILKYICYKYDYEKASILNAISYLLLIFILVFAFYAIHIFFLHIFVHSSGTIFMGPNYTYSYAYTHLGFLVEEFPFIYIMITITIYSVFITMCSLVAYGLSLITKTMFVIPFLALVIADRYLFSVSELFSYKIAITENINIFFLWIYVLLVIVIVMTIIGTYYRKERI